MEAIKYYITVDVCLPVTNNSIHSLPSVEKGTALFPPHAPWQQNKFSNPPINGKDADEHDHDHDHDHDGD